MKYYVAWQIEDIIQIHRKHSPIKVFEEVK